MLAGVGFEKFPEVGTACRENDLVGSEAAAVAGEGDVDEVLFVPEMPKGREDAGMEVVPAQRVLLLRVHVRLQAAHSLCLSFFHDFLLSSSWRSVAFHCGFLLFFDDGLLPIIAVPAFSESPVDSSGFFSS